MRSDRAGRIGGSLVRLFISVLLCSASAAFAGQAVTKTKAIPARITPAIMPLWSEGPIGRELGFGIVDRAGALLLSTGDYNHLHIKQVLSASRSHGWKLKQLSQMSVAKKAAKMLGAQLVLFGGLSPVADGGFDLSFQIYDLRSSKFLKKNVNLPADAGQAVRKGAMALVAAVDAVRIHDNKKIHPNCVSSKAMTAYLACAAVLIEQPMGLRKSHVVNPDRLTGARKKCELAVRLDPGFGAAWAVLSLTHSLALNGDAAAKAMKQALKTDGYLPFGTLAHYWLATRFKSSEHGQQVLRRALERFPGALIFRTYLGEHLNITRKYSQALDVWERYLAVVPQSPYALAQKAYSLARLGKLDEAISLTRKAVEMDDDSLELKLELASRLVDAKRLTEAQKILLPLVNKPGVHGELLLRLGYIYLLEKKDSLAEEFFLKALKIAKGPNEWRTRGRTHYDLAIVYARKGSLPDADKHLLAAAEEGFMMRDLLHGNSDLRVLSDRKSVRHLFHNIDLKLKHSILSTSPFPLDDAGGIIPDAKRKSITGFTF